MTRNTPSLRRGDIIADGRKTSVSLEIEFWDCLREIAEERRIRLSHLTTEICINVRSVQSVIPYTPVRAGVLPQQAIHARHRMTVIVVQSSVVAQERGSRSNLSMLVSNDHASIDRALVQIPLNRTSDGELKEIIQKRAGRTVMTFSGDATWTIIALSRGLTYFTQTLSKFAALHAIDNRRIEVLNKTRSINDAFY